MPMPECDFCPDDAKHEARIMQTDLVDGDVVKVCPEHMPDFAIAFAAGVWQVDPGRIVMAITEPESPPEPPESSESAANLGTTGVVPPKRRGRSQTASSARTGDDDENTSDDPVDEPTPAAS